MNKIAFLLRSLPKTIFFNLKAFDIKQAIKMPIIVSYNTKFGKIAKGRIKINSRSGGKKRILFGYNRFRSYYSK